MKYLKGIRHRGHGEHGGNPNLLQFPVPPVSPVAQIFLRSIAVVNNRIPP